MALNIRNTETERLAAELAVLTGRMKTEAVTEALRDRLERLRRERSRRSVPDRSAVKNPICDEGLPAERRSACPGTRRGKLGQFAGFARGSDEE